MKTMKTNLANISNFAFAMLSGLLLSVSACRQNASVPQEDPKALETAFTNAFYKSFNQTRDFRNANTQEVVDSIQAIHDTENAAMLDHLKKYLLLAGWPEEGSFSRINLKEYISHAPDDFLAEVLPSLKNRVLEGQMPGEVYANIVDGRSLNNGGLQIYGSLVRKDRDGSKLLPYILDINQTNGFRKEIGLPELTEYLLLNGEKD